MASPPGGPAFGLFYMASPLAHSAVGYVLYRTWRDRFPGGWLRGRTQCVLLALTTIGVSLLPDGDAVLGIVWGDFYRFHHSYTHSLVVAAVVALAAAGPFRLLFGGRFRDAGLFIFMALSLHLALDFMTYGRGLMLFWPFTERTWKFPLDVFYGLRWSDGWTTPKHLVTLLNEAAFVALLFLIPWALRRRRKQDAE